MVVSAEDADGIHRIQALVLLALIFMGSHEGASALYCLRRAVHLANESGLASLDAHSPHNISATISQESSRRTWWELYTLDSLLALLERVPPKLSTMSPSDLPLVPCDDSVYEAGDVGGTRTSYADFERRAFVKTIPAFSSHFYRVEAANIVRRVWPFFTESDADPSELEAVGNSIASWPYHLPDSYLAPEVPPGDTDQILVQAHLLVQVSSIFLHFPRSNLPSSAPSAIDVTCLSKGPLGMERSVRHATKSIAASRELCEVASTPSLQESHSPMVICGFLLACAVQLSVASVSEIRASHGSQKCRDRVVLLLGALRHTGKAWSAAQSALHHLQPFADRVFTPPPQDDRMGRETGSGSGPGSGPGSTQVSCGALPSVQSLDTTDPIGNNSATTTTDFASQANMTDFNWFDFFQPTDSSGNANLYEA